MLVAQYLLDYLSEVGATHFFGVTGHVLLPLYALLPSSKLKSIITKHEESAAFMAYGMGLYGKSLGVCAGSAGPGSVHLLTGVSSAYSNSIPMLVITGQIESCKRGKCAFQEMTGTGPRAGNIMQMFESITIFNKEITSAAMVPQVLAEAFRALNSPRKGPVHICFASEVLRMKLPTEEKWQNFSTPIDEISTPKSEDIEQILSCLTEAKAPLILVGRGCKDAEGTLNKFLKASGFPSATTIQGRGLASLELPSHLGIAGILGAPRANSWIENHCDFLLALGTSLNEQTTMNGKLFTKKELSIARVDVDSEAMNFPEKPLFSICTDVEIFLKSLHSKMEEKGASFQGVKTIANINSLPLRTRVEAKISQNSRITPMEIMETLEELSPPDAFYVADSGNNAAWAIHYMQLRRDQKFFIDMNKGCMASSIGSAIGLKLANPDKPVVAICGDGGLYMLGNDISTAVEHGIDITILILNDAKLGMVQQVLRQKFELDGQANIKGANVAIFLEGLGAEVKSVRTTLELQDALKESFRGKRKKSSVSALDIQFDDSYLPLFFPRLSQTEEDKWIADLIKEKNRSCAKSPI